MLKVSVIVPIYNVEKYIERCVRSLMEQTLDGIEYIFVNDSTPDNSIGILSQVVRNYPHRRPNVKLINHKTNKGVAAARTTGMKAATGVYQIHCDPDDWIELDMYERLYNKAKETNADIVVCDFVHEMSNESKIEHVVEIHDFRKDAMKACGTYWWSFDNRLIRSSIIANNNIYPVEGINVTEDVNTIMRTFYYASSIEYVSTALYHYNRLNENSYLHGDSTYNTIQQAKSLKFLLSFFSNKKDASEIVKLLKLSHIATRDSLLAQSKPNWTLWKETLPYTCAFVSEDETLSTIYRLFYRLASKGFLFPLKLYMWLSNKIKTANESSL